MRELGLATGLSAPAELRVRHAVLELPGPDLVDVVTCSNSCAEGFGVTEDSWPGLAVTEKFGHGAVQSTSPGWFLPLNDITRLRIFGSAARGDDRPDPDVDLLADFDPRVSFFDLIQAEDGLAAFCARPVDLLTEGAISRYMRETVLNEAEVIFDARGWLAIPWPHARHPGSHQRTRRPHEQDGVRRELGHTERTDAQARGPRGGRRSRVTLKRPEDQEFFQQRYARETSAPAREVEQLVFGQDLGVNGYTTVAQAERLCEVLELKAASRLLEVGTGKGWPGTFIASASGCHLVLSDVPLEGLRHARRYAVRRGVSRRTIAVAADGRAMPFRASSFEGLVHTDVLCWIADKLSVLRAGHAVLTSHGRMAGYTIHVEATLDPDGARKAAECGPSEVTTDAPYEELFAAAGFRVALSEDVTTEFEATCRAIFEARQDREAALREAEGDALFEEEQQKKARLIEGLSTGVLRRSLHLAVKQWRLATWPRAQPNATSRGSGP